MAKYVFYKHAGPPSGLVAEVCVSREQPRMIDYKYRLGRVLAGYISERASE